MALQSQLDTNTQRDRIIASSQRRSETVAVSLEKTFERQVSQKQTLNPSAKKGSGVATRSRRPRSWVVAVDRSNFIDAEILFVGRSRLKLFGKAEKESPLQIVCHWKDRNVPQYALVLETT